MKLKDDYVVASRIFREKSELFILTNNNKYKISILQDIPERGRGSGGIKVFKLDLEDFVKTAYISQSQIVLVNSKFKNINKKYYYSKRDSKGIECDLVFKFFSN